MHTQQHNAGATPEETFETNASPPLVVGLRCSVCDHRFSSKFAWAMVNADSDHHSGDWDGILLSDIATCPTCGALDEYSIAPESKLALTVRSMARAVDGGQPGRVAYGVSQLWDGTLVQRPMQALAHLRSLVEAHPESAQAFRCLGNACSRWQRVDEAVEAWHRACELDDAEIEAAFSLAKYLLRPGDRVAEGFFYLRRVIATIPSSVHTDTVSGQLGRRQRRGRDRRC